MSRLKTLGAGLLLLAMYGAAGWLVIEAIIHTQPGMIP